MRKWRSGWALALAVAAAAGSGVATAQVAPMTPDITGKKFVAPDVPRDFTKRVVMIPMRDGVKLYTVIVMPKFDAETALGLIEEHGVTHSQWVPTMFIRMLKLPAEVRDRIALKRIGEAEL